jgi:calcineurin-like phosphoesterase family protein
MAGADEAMYRHGGRQVDNAKLHGSWKAVAQVATMEAFDPAKPVNGHHATIKTVTFNNDGTTDSDALFWSGDMLINIEKLEALKMTVKTIAGTEYLFVESGNFDGRRGANWKTPLMVMKR